MSEDNPMNYCMNCNKYLGFRGYCSKECHDESYKSEEDLKDD